MKIYWVGLYDNDYISTLDKLISNDTDVEIVRAHSQFLDRTIPRGACIHIHWPEAYISSPGSRKREIKNFLSALHYYRENPILLTLHNLEPHEEPRRHGRALYAEVLRVCNVVVHLGPASIDILTEQYVMDAQLKHIVIPHHVFPPVHRLDFDSDQCPAPSDARMIFSPGRMRYAEDIAFLWKAWRAEGQPRMVIHRMNQRVNRWFLWNAIRHWRSILAEVRVRWGGGDIQILQRSLSREQLQKYVGGAHLIICARCRQLNSGVPALVAPFSKPIITNAGGNIPFTLECMGYQHQPGTDQFLPKGELDIQHYNASVALRYQNLYHQVE